MTDYPHRVQIESVQWLEVLPGLRLFRSFRQSLSPGRMFLALCLVVLLYLGGKALDVVWGAQVYPNSVENYIRNDTQDNTNIDVERQPIFQTLLDRQLYHFDRMIGAAVSLNFGLTELLTGPRTQANGVLGEVRRMVITLPGWLYHTHPGFMVVYLLYGFILSAILGGAIARLAAIDACRGLRHSPFDALRFSIHHGGWLISAPLLPLILAGLIGLLIALPGLLFNAPVLDIFGALMFGLLLLGGFLVALLLLGVAAGFNLLTPAIAVEGCDAFDANSRAFSYILAHPWRYLLYLTATIVYSAIGYLLVGLLVFLTLWATKTFVGLWVFTDAAEGLGRFDAILPDPMLGHLMAEPNTDQLGGSATVAATLVGVWVKLLLAILPAFCVSFYFTAMTWTYLLLRYHTDGEALDQLTLEPDPDVQATQVPDKVEPEATPSP